MARLDVQIDDKALREFVARADGTRDVLAKGAESIRGNAAAMSSGFRTGIWHDENRVEYGDTPTEYKSDCIDRGRGYVGLVYTGNYSAMKDTHEHNTLLKAIGGAHV